MKTSSSDLRNKILKICKTTSSSDLIISTIHAIPAFKNITITQINSALSLLVEENKINLKITQSSDSYMLNDSLYTENKIEERKVLDCIVEKKYKFIFKFLKIGLGICIKKELIIIKDGVPLLTPNGKELLKNLLPLEKAIRNIQKGENIHDIDGLKEGISRKIIIVRKNIQKHYTSIDSKSIKNDEIKSLTSEIILNWDKYKFKKYDLNPPISKMEYVKKSPLDILKMEIKNFFLSIGLKEITMSSLVSSCLWNMDALFVPQDHPARTMQDTFYVKGKDPAEDIEEKIKEMHQNLWGYAWNSDEGRRHLLKTHNTCDTVKHLLLKGDTHHFIIDKIFRRETIDETHLPEFQQVDVIIEGETMSCRTLMTLLKKLYSHLGFHKIRFRVGYFPYTEPSFEVDGWHKNRWVELGGCGMIRKEICDLAGRKQAIAFGLGIERILLLRGEVPNLSAIYEWNV